MCGICGAISRTQKPSLNTVRAMQNLLRQRGPDDDGAYSDDHVSLGMTRLSIIDQERGHQPLYNEDKNVVAIVNGEIYNFIELRRKLIKLGHSFKTGSDCETIVHLYEEYGCDFVHYLRGMFAIALWDKVKKRLVLVRDRLGEKPLFIYQTKKEVYFASELKAIKTVPDYHPQLDPLSVIQYFYYQYVPEPNTILLGIHKLPAGHIMTIDQDTWRINQYRYWLAKPVRLIDQDPVALIKKELTEISEIIVRSDRPIGIALSGGLDSSSIAALIGNRQNSSTFAFTIGYKELSDVDERENARQLALSLKIPWYFKELSTNNIVESFEELIYQRDEPITDIAGHGYQAVMALAALHQVPVILLGIGGDELFWGYPAMRRTAQKHDRVSQLSGLAPLVPAIKVLRSGSAKILPSNTAATRHRVRYNYEHDYLETKKYFPAIRGPYLQSFSESQFSVSVVRNAGEKTATAITRLMLDTYLLGNGISQVDRLGMANSVEARLPFADYQLVELILSIRQKYADQFYPPKTLLKQALKGLVPDSILDRPKRGFTPPHQLWEDALRRHYGQSLIDGHLVKLGIITEKAALALIQGYGLAATLPLKTIVLELWCRQYLKL